MQSNTKRQSRATVSRPGRRKSRFLRPSNNRLVNIATAAITTIIVLVSAFWIAGFRFYVVSSTSMAPTLEGSTGRRDRILCWMLPGLYRQPRRWEVVIFHTPSTAKSQEMLDGVSTPEEMGITIKRLIGLPGERLALANGDIWAKPPNGGAFIRQSKPEVTQRAMWISVYDEDFSDVTLDEFCTFWRASDSDGLSVRRGGGLLRMAAGSSIRYKPLSRNVNAVLPELPGIPDRYVLPQDVQYLCSKCGKSFPGFIRNQKIQERCPNCDTLNYEGSVSVYGFRSGLPDIGEYSAGDVIEGDADHFRDHPYYFVSDLRTTLEFNPETATSKCEITLHDDEGEVRLSIGPGGAALNNVPLSEVSLPAVGVWTTVEFHRADGHIRVYLNGSTTPAYNRPHGPQRKPDAEYHNRTSGVAVGAGGGSVAIRSLAIDRDVYYFSGYSKAVLNYMGRIGPDGEIDIPAGTFFPLGDNTTVSFDGRSWGPIEEKLLMGTSVAIWQPKSRRRFIH